MFVVVVSATAAPDLRQGALDDPAARQRGEAFLVGGLSDQFGYDPRDLAGVGHELQRTCPPRAQPGPSAASSTSISDLQITPVDPLAGVIAARVGADGVGALDRLGVDDPARGHRVAAGGVAQRVVDAVDGAVVAPVCEVPVDGLPGRQVVGQQPPGAADAVDLQDRALFGATAGGRWGQQRSEQCPLLSAHVGGVSGTVRTRGSGHAAI